MIPLTVYKGYLLISIEELRKRLELPEGTLITSVHSFSDKIEIAVQHPSIPPVDDWHSTQPLAWNGKEWLCLR